MPQGRIILKSISESKKMASLRTDGARLLYTWLIPQVDIQGCFSGDPKVIKGKIFTRLSKNINTIERYLEDLESNKLIKRYTYNDDRFLIIPDFVEKQPYLNPLREALPVIPLPTQINSRGTPEELQRNSNTSKVKDKEKVKEKDKEKEKEKVNNINILSAKKSTRDKNIKILIDYFFNKHKEVYKLSPLINGGKDGKLLMRLLKNYDVDDIKNLLDFFLTQKKDKFLEGCSKSISVFCSATVFNKLLTYFDPQTFKKVEEANNGKGKGI